MNENTENNINSDISANPDLNFNNDYHARLTEFEGPMDILLHFVKVDVMLVVQ